MASNLRTYKRKYSTADAPGLDAIAEQEQAVYGDQVSTHWPTDSLDDEETLWGIDIYKSTKQQPHLHYITLGLTNLFYNEELADEETSGAGIELTFRYTPLKDEDEQPVWPSVFLQNVARYIFKSGNAFEAGDFMAANGAINPKSTSAITAFVFIEDAEMKSIPTPHGDVQFLQVYGITGQEYQDLKSNKYTSAELIEKQRANNPLLITDMNRK